MTDLSTRVALALLAAALCCAGCEAIAGYSDREQEAAEASDAAPCSPGQVLCDAGACADPAHDVHNCGACGHACGAGQACVSGVCSCAAPATACGTSCVDLLTDKSHCGTCTHACGILEGCDAGVCGWR